MKKVCLIFTLIILCLCLASCENLPFVDSSKSNANKTGDTAFDNVTPDPELKYPDDPRKFVVKYILDMALTPWTPAETFQMYGKYQAWSYNLTYEKGVRYFGPPFLTNSRGTLQEFQYNIEDGVYIGGTTASSCIGSACYDAVYVSLIQVCPSISFESTEDMLPGNETGLLAVGDWDITISKHDTKNIINEYTIAEMSQFYAQLKPGDIVLKHIVAQDAGHTRIVSGGPVIYYNNDGTLNYKKSYITTIEQTNAWDKQVSHHTNWYVDHSYTFENLYKNNFVPLTAEDYTKDVSRAAITPTNIINANEIVNAKKLKGELKSNHYMTQIKVSITDEEDNVVYERSIFPNTKYYNLYDFSYRPDLDNYTSGAYNFKIEASVAFGTKVIADYNFVLK
ncbi:MAG: hypothetical protein IKU48_02155 [Clostridia bacterium]|nr:hypothetical protein [Clostridia bacterium]